MSLKSYQQKRNFKKTSEPKGKIKSTTQKNLYLIQKHAASHLHYDFRLELDGTLKSWAIPKGPSLDPSVKRLAVHVEDHPLDYGNFEGVIPQGQYGGGTVMLWDTGTWSTSEDQKKAYANGHLTFEIKGKKLKGSWKLIRIKSDPKNWLLMKANDKYAHEADDYDITLKKTKSVLSKKTIDEIGNTKTAVWNSKNKDKTTGTKKSTLPKLIKPQLATLVDAPPVGKEWLHEIKLDGYRLIAYIENKNVRLMTRGNKDWTTKFPNIAKALKQLSLTTAIFDGEVVVLDNHQHSNFQLLQNAIHDKEQDIFIYYIFDLIYYDGHDLSSLPLIKRKAILQNLIPVKNSSLHYSDHVTGSGEKIFTKSCKLGLEGIMSKKSNSLYTQKRTENWLKVKCTKRQEFIIVGYTKPKGTRRHFGSLLLGVYADNGKLTYSGHVGTGFDKATLKVIYQELKKHETAQMSFEKKPPNSSHVTWVKPVLVAEVEFTEWTSDRILRHPSFKGLRLDKPAKNISYEMPASLTQKKKSKTTISKTKTLTGLTHPDKVLYPEKHITKAALLNYYKFIQKWMMPYITNRPLTLLRCPNGQQEKCFYQKHIEESALTPLKSTRIKEKFKTENCIYLDNAKGLLSLPQLATLEIHTWGSKINKIEKPDMLVFDLDPAPDVKWKDVVAAAFDIRNFLKKLKLTSFVKSTGGKGLHVVVPIKPEYTWDQIKIFSHTLVIYLTHLNPNKYIGKMTKSERKGKIFIDYLRNQRGATAVAPYSTRARSGATVATPLDWDELTSNINDTTYDINTIVTRMKNLKRDPWQKFFKIKQSIKLDKL